MAKAESRRDEALADLVTARWWLADEHRSARIKVWDRSYEDHDPAYVDKTIVNREPFIKYPYLDRVRNIQTTTIMDATESAGRVVWAQHLTPDDDSRRRSESATEYLEWTYWRPAETQERTNRAAAERVAQMGLTYGDAYFHVRWKRGYACYESVSPYDLWIDARYGEWYILAKTITLSRLGDVAEGLSAPETQTVEDPQTGLPTEIEIPARDGGRARKVFKAVEKAIREGKRQQGRIYRSVAATDMDRRFDFGRISGDSEFDANGGVDPKDDPFNAEIVIFEYHETHPDGIVAQVIPGFGDADRNLVLQKEQNPYGICTLVSFRPRPVDNEFYGIGNGEASGGPARAIDYNFRASLAIVGAQGWPPLLNTRRSNLRKNFLGSVYGLVIDVEDVTRDLAWMAPSVGPSTHQFGAQIAQQAADVGTGEGARDPGKMASAGSATQGAILENYASLTDRAILRAWRRTMEQLAHVTMAVASVHVTETQMIPVMGRRTPEFVEMRPEMFEGPWYFRFGGSARNATQALSGHLNIAQTYSATGELDMRESLREAYRLLGERDPERFLVRKDDVPPTEPRREHLMILDGQSPMVSGREDHLRHWQEHEIMRQRWALVMESTDPRMLRLVVHIQATVMAWQQQQAALQQGGGSQPTAPEMFGPQNAGQPGQPASAQPAFGNLNETRQGSNGAAAGQAPGLAGSVPGRTMGAVATGQTARAYRQ